MVFINKEQKRYNAWLSRKQVGVEEGIEKLSQELKTEFGENSNHFFRIQMCIKKVYEKESKLIEEMKEKIKEQSKNLNRTLIRKNG